MSDATNLPAIGSTWKHRDGDIYLVMGFSNMRQPGRPAYPPTIRYCDGEGYEYSGRLDDWRRRMTWLADPVPTARPIDPEHARRVTELITANNVAVEARRALRRENDVLKAQVAERGRLLHDALTFLENAPEARQVGGDMWVWRYQVDLELHPPAAATDAANTIETAKE